MLARPRPVVELIVLRKSPIDWRAPIVTANTPPAATSTSQNATRRVVAAPPVAASAIGGLLGFVDRRQALVEQRMELGDALLAEPGIERELRPLPLARAFGVLLAPGRRRRHEARAAIGAGADHDPAVGDQRLQVARQGRGVHLHRLGDVAG